MTEIRRPAEIVRDASDLISSGAPNFRRALMFNPPVYDAQYWARWSQPAGLLRVATLLKSKGYHVDLIDCMETDAGGRVKKARRRNLDGTFQIKERDDITKIIWHHGLSWEEAERRLRALDPADEVWIGSIMTYWWESTRDAIALIRRVFPNAHILAGGIYPTLAPEHASNKLGADVIFKGEVEVSWRELPSSSNSGWADSESTWPPS